MEQIFRYLGMLELRRNPAFKMFDEVFDYANDIRTELVRAYITPYVPVWVRPNILTGFSAFCLTPSILYLIYSADYWLAWLSIVPLLFLAYVIDASDGVLARDRDQTSDRGKILDPANDKVLIGGALLILIWPVSKSLVIAIFVSEALLCLTYAYETFRLKQVSGSNCFGKAKMVIQSLSLFVLIVAKIDAGYAFSALLEVISIKSFWFIALPLSWLSIIQHLVDMGKQKKT